MSEYIERGDVCYQLAKLASEDGQPRAIRRAAKVVANFPAADVVSASDFRDCRNELCLKCGAYTQKHNGACDGCKWRKT